LGFTGLKTHYISEFDNEIMMKRYDFDLPSKGVWLIICGYEWGTNTNNTIQIKELALSIKETWVELPGYGLRYFEEINDPAGTSGRRQEGTISGVASVDVATKIYVHSGCTTSTSTGGFLRTNISWTRIG
jgi:hypothetical protein